MLSIDVPSVFKFTALLSVFLGMLLLWLWRRDRSQPALASWGVARLLVASALALLVARGAIPDWISIGLANALLCLNYGLTWGGARQFEGRRAIPAVISAGAVVWLLACQIPGFFAHPMARLWVLGPTLAVYNVAAALEFRRGQTQAPLPSRPLAVALLSGTALIYGGSAVLGCFVRFSAGGSGLPTAPWFAALSSLAMILATVSTLLLVALTKEQAELRTTTVLAAARDAAAEASAQKTRFLARMSHELRTPLNGVLGLAQVLASDPAQGEQQRRQATTLEQAGRHLLEILNEILDLSRIEAGRLELLPRPVALAEFLGDALTFEQGAAAAKGVALGLSAAPALPRAVLADPMRLRQILLNLLGNAVKFTPAGGHITLAVTCLGGDRLGFSVTDTGPGVPLALRPRLFQDYAQAEGDAIAGSSGLGLAISARLARAMGGDLTHADGPGGIGSRFTLALPLPAVASAETPPGTPLSLPPRGLRILVVDDVATNRLVARALLRQAGHVVEEAADGPAALAAITQGPLPDVVLMDVSMPGMDGHTAARHIRSMPGPAGRLPIVAVTANALPEEITLSLTAGMDGHVTKPIERTALLNAIASALDRAARHQQGRGLRIA
jgi:signal transduction histidine kinase/CheY-like chemotaxis protein